MEMIIFHSPFSFFYNGEFAVSIFFVLSGYVLTRSYFINGDDNILVKRVFARYPRLVIPALISNILVYLLLKLNLYKIKELALTNGAEKLFSYQQLFIFPNALQQMLTSSFFTTWLSNHDYSKMFNLVLWTMTIEFKGSLLVLAMAFFIKKTKYKILVIFMLSGLFLCFSKTNGIYYIAFLLGLLLASYEIKVLSTRSNYWVKLGLVISLYLGGYNHDSQGYFFIFHRFDTFLISLANPGTVYHVIAATILIFTVLKSTRIQNFLASPIIVYFGHISFPLYLVHQPLIFSICSLSFLYTNKTIGYHPSALLALVILVLVTLPISILSRNTIEQFSIKVSHEFAKFMLLNSSQD